MFNVRAYRLDTEGNQQITPHFKVREFRCYDNTNIIFIAEDLVKLLEEVRIEVSAPIIINSGYRTPAHNKKVGGATNSYHMLGVAADISCARIPVQKLYDICAARLNGWGGLGKYKSFVHVDIRPTKSRWNG